MMALPTSMVNDLTPRLKSGIILGISPSTGGPYRIEIQRSTVNSTASTAWTSIFLDPTSQEYRFTDYLPLSTRTFYYRMRHWGLGLANSSFSAVINAKPAKLPDAFQPIRAPRNNLGNVEFTGSDIYLSSAKFAKVGTQVTTGTLEKRARFDKGAFRGLSSTVPFVTLSGYLHPNSTNAQPYDCPVVLHSSVRIKSIRLRCNRQSTAGAASLTLQRSSGNGVATGIIAVTISSGGWQTKESSTVAASSAFYSTARSYYLRLSLKNGGAGTSRQTQFMFGEVIYKVGTLDKV